MDESIGGNETAQDTPRDDELEKYFPGPSADPVLTLTFLLELPQCLRIVDSSILAGEPGDPWSGWTHEAMELAAGFHSLPEGSRPSYAIRIGQSRVREGVPLDAAVRAFKHWDRGAGSNWSRFRRRLTFRLSILRGQRIWRSCALVTLFVAPVPVLAIPGRLDHDWLLARLDDALAELNQYLISLAALTDEWQISSISRLDVQRNVPFMVSVDPYLPGWTTFADSFDAHPYLPRERSVERPTEEIIQAIDMVQGNRSGRLPFFQFLELYQSAEHHLNSGRSGQAVIAACTATEVFVNTLFREAGKALGTKQDKIDGVLGCGFRNQLVDHLPKLLREGVDLDDLQSSPGTWWKHCYDLRNQVVHAGAKPTDKEAELAKVATSKFIRWIYASLIEDPRLDFLRLADVAGPRIEG